MPEFEFSFEKELSLLTVIAVSTLLVSLIWMWMFWFMTSINNNKIEEINEQQKVLLQKIQDNNDEMRSSFKSLSRDVDKLWEDIIDMPYYISRAKEVEDLCKTPQSQKHFWSTGDCILYMNNK